MNTTQAFTAGIAVVEVHARTQRLPAHGLGSQSL